MIPIRLTVATSLALVATGIGVTNADAAASSSSTAQRSGCVVVRDASGDTAANVGAPATLPQSDANLDLTGVDLASNDRWIGARVRLTQLEVTAPTTGGEAFEVSLKIAGGTLILGVGRYANATGINGDDKYAYAGYQRGTLAPRDVPARAVQLSIDAFADTVSVFVDRAALKDIGATITGTVWSVTAISGRKYGDEFTVDYDEAAGSTSYKLGAPSCLRLPS